MTDDVKTEEEPSIEEILDSIRQIIADDDEDGEEVEGGVAAENTDKEETPDEPLDQSDIDDMDFSAPETTEPEGNKAEPLDQSAIDDIDFDTPTPEPEEEVIELTDIVDDVDIDLVDTDSTPPPEDEPTPEPEITPEPEPPTPEPEPEKESEPEMISDSDALLTKNAENAAFHAISELARKTAIEHNGITLEEIVRSEIKPMLSIWLDKNLPVIIERLVQEELERVSKRVLED